MSEDRKAGGRGKTYITQAVKGIAQLKVDRLMEKHSRNPNSSMEDIINSLIEDTLKVEDLPLEDRMASLAMSTYLVGILQGFAIVRESRLVSEDVMIKIVSSISPEYIPEEGEDIPLPEEPGEIVIDPNEIFASDTNRLPRQGEKHY